MNSSRKLTTFLLTLILLVAGVISNDVHKGLSWTFYTYAFSKSLRTAKDGKVGTTTTKSSKKSRCSTALSNCKAVSKRAGKTLKKVKRILEEEKKRWTKIHRNPVKDEVKVKVDEKNNKITVDVKIGPVVKNEVNSKPITRKYTFNYEYKDSLLGAIDFYLGGGYAYSLGALPLFGIGVRPFKKLKTSFVNDLGVGVYTMIYCHGITLYYSPRVIRPLSFHILGGVTNQKEFTFGAAISARF